MYDNVPPAGWVIGLTISLVIIGALRWWLRRSFTPNDGAPPVMSRRATEEAESLPIAAPLPATSTNGGQGIAKPGNAINEPLPGNAVADILDNPSSDITAAREAIRFQAKVEALADLVNAGKVPQAEGIEIVFHCKRSGRAESPYARARAAIQAHITLPAAQYREYPGPLAQLQPANGHEE
jgi:hypothetical protein